MIKINNLLSNLNDLKINYKKYDHLPLFSVEDSIESRGNIPGSHTKNIFLKNKKNNFFLFSCDEKQVISIKNISKSLRVGTLSFAKEEYLKKYLGVLPGSVSPFGLLNDIENKVNFYLDKSLMDQKMINFHPLINTSTINLKIDDFINFLIENNKKVNIYDFNNYSLIS